ncbi:SAM-dependent methyltransferase [Rathayibacter sp. AY1E4]|uniref:N-6 DNA methylase n=1 Tax=unclassified Rathayibacter TaxID=2609250 RepID=UPI000CE8BA8B|nr:MULTISPECIES: N-6 DNA methylase [unclassified Rathayibacter]PPF09987.1 SAM-dependent methyltransferase [Rathayibacter sp. AY1A5]PPF33083.1 SAM-dependent methyltransferase [Rathayibacter sp. AY1A2]PPG37117.1 SAM-dependent methyltransferase [Rathayibacter sp. AY2B5]PPH08218.1 SAM-dependent methyltransferase [Rathayibacter sp. AY1C1]PPH14429.1 SAM-dependent methyltransferase [Rathayibacter sp. AY1F8]
MKLLPGDSAELRKARGAFFTPPAIAEHLAEWAIRGDAGASVLDPTCGEAVFLIAAGQELKRLGQTAGDLDSQLFGVDLHEASLVEAMTLLEDEGLDGTLIASDFFAVQTPDMLGATVPFVDAVIGNPPFVRYQEHVGVSRRLSAEAALRGGVRLSGLASSWAASLVHSAGFLKPDGRLAMVLPAELLTVGYAEPIRAWLRSRFERVSLVLFERLQFEGALADVVLLLAEGRGGCDSFSLYHVDSADDLAQLRPYTHTNVTPPTSGKWTDILIPKKQRGLYREVIGSHFSALGDYGRVELGAVTGGNSFFALTEATRLEYGLAESQLVKISPPGTRHFHSSVFTAKHWQELRERGERVWLFRPAPTDDSDARRAYTAYGESLHVNEAYKCQIRSPWWRPPVAAPPDLFFTYMSHNYPRLITNTAKVGFLNSMHGIRLHADASADAAAALPLLCLNSATMLGAEINGRSYGGGILKMEPREATSLPVPNASVLAAAWAELKPMKSKLEKQLAAGEWTEVAKRVDAAVLGTGVGLAEAEIAELLEAARQLRSRRLNRGE